MTVQLCRLMSTSVPRDRQASSSAPAEQRPPTPSSAGLVGTREGPPAPPASSPCWTHGPAAVPDLRPARSPCRGKGTKGRDARSAGQGPRLPALPSRRGTPLPPQLRPARLWRGKAPGPHTHPQTRGRAGRPRPLLTAPRLHSPTGLSLAPSPRHGVGSLTHPGSSRSSPAPQSDRAGLSSLPAPLTGPRPVIPSRQRARFSLPPLTAAHLPQPSHPSARPRPPPAVAHRGRPCLLSQELATPSPSAAAPRRSNQQQDGGDRGGGAPCWPS